MNFLRFRVITLSLVSLLATAAYAVEQLPEKEEDIPVEYIATFDNTVSVGMRHTSGKAKVKFGSLGVGNNVTGVDQYGGRYYSNGTVSADAASVYEYNDSKVLVTAPGEYKNANSSASNSTVNFYSVREAVTGATGQDVVTVYSNLYAYENTSTTGTPSYALKRDANGNYEYQKNPDGTTLRKASTYKFLAYNAAQTRNWSVKNASQIHTDAATGTGTVEMTTYAASSAGATAEAEGGSSSGFEINLERRLRRFGKLEIGFSGGVSLADINMKTSSVVLANKLETTDIYKLVNTGLNGGFFTTNNSAGTIFQPTGAVKPLSLLDLVGGTQMYDLKDATTLIPYLEGADLSGVTPLSLAYTAGTQRNAGMVLVQGTWQVKGAYYHAKVGPTFRYRFNDRWAISGGFGMSMCYVGTVFKADEEIFDISNGTAVGDSLFHPVEENNTHKFVPGYYGDLNAELWVTERTGFYAGINYEKLGNYSQKPLSGRTAKIDLGTSMGWRIGIMTRF